jgi:hypothetical protein
VQPFAPERVLIADDSSWVPVGPGAGDAISERDAAGA